MPTAATSAKISDFLTESEIKTAIKWWRSDRSSFHKKCCEKIITPNMARINAALGQENDPRFLTYAVEYAMMKTNHGERK
jgi:hypothetical protein